MSAVLEKPKPGGLAFLLPVLLWIVTSVIAVVLLVQGVRSAEDTFDDFARIEPGQDTQVELSSSGGYRVWLERPGINESSATEPGTIVTITDSDGNQVNADYYVGSLDFSSGGRDATAVQTFSVDEPGTFTINATVSDAGGGTFLVGKGNPVSETAKGLGLFFLVGTLGFVIALIILIVMLVKRSRSKKRIRQAAFGATPGYGPAPAYGAAPGYGPPGYPQSPVGPSYGAPPPTPGPPPPGSATPPPAPGSPPPPPGWGGPPPPA